MCELTVDESHLNRLGGLHGGFTATVIDQMTAVSLMARSGQLFGASTDLNIS